MRNSIWIAVLVVGVTLVGCATAKQAAQDYQAGKPAVTPLAEGEIAPAQQAQDVTNLLTAIPYVGPFAPIAAPFLLGFFTWKRGRRLRKGMATSTNPITGALGPKIGIGAFNLENIVQTITDMFKGGYEVGADGSGLKRGYKTALSIILALVSGAFLIPGAKEWILGNGTIVAGVTALAALFSGVEKKLQEVKPVVLQPATPTP